MNGICRSRNWEGSIDFEVLITKLRRLKWFRTVRYMKGNLHWLRWHGTSEKLRYIRVFDISSSIYPSLFNMEVNGVKFGPWYLFDIYHVFVKTELDISEFYCMCCQLDEYHPLSVWSCIDCCNAYWCIKLQASQYFRQRCPITWIDPY